MGNILDIVIVDYFFLYSKRHNNVFFFPKNWFFSIKKTPSSFRKFQVQVVKLNINDNYILTLKTLLALPNLTAFLINFTFRLQENK
jgi:hypothetical protein